MVPGTEDVTVWYKSDAGVVTNESGVVTCWENQGSIGNTADLHAYTGTVTVAENALTSSDGTANYDALQFSTACFMTTNATSPGLSSTTLSSWFIVYVPSDVEDEQTDAGLFGFNNNSTRYGAFFPRADGGYTIRTFMGGAPDSVNAQASVPHAWHLADTSVYPSIGGGFRGAVSINGGQSVVGGVQNSHAIQTTARLKVGHFREDEWGKFFNGGIAELRIYGRPLNPVERMYVEKELSEKYGLSFNHPFWNGSETATATYRTDIQMTGLENVGGTGGATGFASGGLMVASDGGDGNVKNVWLGHNGQTAAWTTSAGTSYQAKLSREWYVEFVQTPTDIVRLTFTEGTYVADEDYVLLYRKTDGDTAWSVLPYTADVVSGTVSFRLSLGAAQTGFYTVGKGSAPVSSLPCAGVSSGLTGWFRADTGLVIENGAVVKWCNLGATGSVGGSPVCTTAGFPRTASGQGEACVRFDGVNDTLRLRKRRDGAFMTISRGCACATWPMASTRRDVRTGISSAT